MPLLKLERAQLAFGHIPLLDNADFQLDPGERVALIGRNGTGKSSLLAALVGKVALDAGQVWTAPGLKLAYVEQEPVFIAENSVFSSIVDGMGEISALLAAYHQVSQKLAEATGNQLTASAMDELLDQLAHLQHELEAQNAWGYQARAEQLISTFGLEADSLVGTLSGGQKKRLALARALAHSPDILLLDEPTNHLDISAITWLEAMLGNSNLSMVFITHDRSFLEHLATRIIELDRGKLTSFPGDFASYQERKAGMLHEESLQQARADKLLKAEEVWIRKGVEARRTRAVFRVQRLQQLRLERSARRERLAQVKISVERGDRGGKLVAELKHVSKAFADKVLIRDFSTRILSGDKIGLIGKNGAGKTTLLRLLLGELQPDSGHLHLGTRLNIAYFDQFRAQLDPEARLQDIISPGSDYVEINGNRKHVIGYLEDFLFAPERARSPVKSLSGGERNRLLLARLFARPANVLVLDEPTNDLDIETLELLEQLLGEYTGTLFLVSHDRSFLDNIVTQTIVHEGEGLWYEYAGGYSDWLEQSINRPANRPDKSAEAKEKPEPTRSPPPKKTTAKPDKASWKELQELSTLPDTIAKLEAEQSTLTQRLEDPSLYSQDPQAAQEIASRLSAIESELLYLLERWEVLEGKVK